MSETEADLSQKVTYHQKLARRFDVFVWAIYLLSILASFAAGIYAASDFPEKPGLPLLTAIPGALLLLNSTFKFSARSQWHYEKKSKLNNLLRLARSGARATSAPEVAEKWNRIDEEMDKTRPTWGDLPNLSTKI